MLIYDLFITEKCFILCTIILMYYLHYIYYMYYIYSKTDTLHIFLLIVENLLGIFQFENVSLYTYDLTIAFLMFVLFI
jgi:hypothetical protein